MTIKQMKLAREVGKGRTFQEAALKAGYAPTTAHQQTNITKTKGWKELLDQYLPDDDILRAPKDALKANKIILSHTEPDREVPDHMIRLKAAELSSKLKRKLGADNTINIDKAIVMPILGGKTKE